jgi:hypothetical protein
MQVKLLWSWLACMLYHSIITYQLLCFFALGSQNMICDCDISGAESGDLSRHRIIKHQ